MGTPINIQQRDGKTTGHEQTIARFRRTLRRRLRALVRQHDRFGDLVVAFPAAAFALVTMYGPATGRQRARTLVIEGAPLKAIAKALGVPFWMRKLAPELLVDPFPVTLPADDTFGQRLVGLQPATPRDVRWWLTGVLHGYAVAGDMFACWLATKPCFLKEGRGPEPHQLLALFAWASTPGDIAVTRLLPGRFNPRMEAAAAAERAADWVEAIERDIVMGDAGLVDPWLKGGRAAGFRFVPLVTVRDLQCEAEAMDNCVADYDHQLIRNECRLFGIRRGARHVATVEVRPHPYHPGLPTIAQLYGPDNEPAPHAVWAAAFTWLGKQGRFDLPEAGCHNEGNLNQNAWKALWRPYWRDFGPHPLLPEELRRGHLETLRAAGTALERAARDA